MNDTKPFDLAAAKAGAPYACRDGKQATVLKWDRNNQQYPLVGVFDYDDTLATWAINGSIVETDADGYELVMLPLGYIDGKPVFVGDEYEFEGTRYRAVENGSGGFDSCRWPEPAKQYPQTKMTDQELYAPDSLRATANAALRHAIDSEQVVPMAEVLAHARELNKSQRAARDLAIAEAVRKACAHKTNGAWYNQTGSSAACAVWKRIQEEIDLPAIIATVKP